MQLYSVGGVASVFLIYGGCWLLANGSGNWRYRFIPLGDCRFIMRRVTSGRNARKCAIQEILGYVLATAGWAIFPSSLVGTIWGTYWGLGIFSVAPIGLLLWGRHIRKGG
jgi:hypothetical protein